MKPQPPVTRIRTAPDTSSAAKVKPHTRGTAEGYTFGNSKSLASRRDIHVNQLLTGLPLGGMKRDLPVNFGKPRVNEMNGVITRPIEATDTADPACCAVLT